jgi:hypothetical protein
LGQAAIVCGKRQYAFDQGQSIGRHDAATGGYWPHAIVVALLVPLLVRFIFDRTMGCWLFLPPAAGFEIENGQFAAVGNYKRGASVSHRKTGGP